MAKYDVYLKDKKYGTVVANSLGGARVKAYMALGISYKVDVRKSR